jgi:hypothetical protein
MKHSLITASLAVGSFALLVGCGKSPTGLNNGNNDPTLAISYEETSGDQIAQETADISQSFTVSPSSLSKTVATTSDAQLTLSGQSWSYVGGWWMRSGQFTATGSLGENITLNGYDSAQFKDVSGAIVQYPIALNATSATLGHLSHFYIENSLGGYVDMGRTYAISGAINRGTTDTTLVLNGTLQQYFKAENANKTAYCDYSGSARAVNITFKKADSGWSKPLSGSINVTSPYRVIDIVFTNGVAQVTVSDKSGQVKRSVQVTL